MRVRRRDCVARLVTSRASRGGKRVVMLLEEFGGRHDGRQRRAQLVADVGHEPPLALDAGGDGDSHLVERVGDRVEVRVPGVGKAHGEVAVREATCTGSHPPQWAHQQATDVAPDRPAHRERAQCQESQEQGAIAQRLEQLAEREQLDVEPGPRVDSDRVVVLVADHERLLGAALREGEVDQRLGDVRRGDRAAPRVPDRAHAHQGLRCTHDGQLAEHLAGLGPPGDRGIHRATVEQGPGQARGLALVGQVAATHQVDPAGHQDRDHHREDGEDQRNPGPQAEAHGSGLEPVAEPANRHQVHGLGRVGLHLRPQAVDEVVHDPAVTGVAVAPDVAQQVVAADHPLAGADQLGEQLVLRRAQRDDPLADLDLGGVRTQPDLAALQQAVVDLDVVGPPDLRPDPGQQLLGDERLGDVVVGAGLQARHDVVAVGLRGDDDDRHPAGGPHAAHDVQPVDPRQPQVDEQHVRVLVLAEDQRLLAVGRLEDAVPLVLQGVAQHQADLLVVLDDHHSLAHGRYSTPTDARAAPAGPETPHCDPNGTRSPPSGAAITPVA